MFGINSQKLIKKNISGISFALSASDLLEVLHRFYPAQTRSENSANTASSRLLSGLSLMTAASATQSAVSYGNVEITSEPDAAGIYLDDRFVGSTPAQQRIPEGAHRLLLKLPGRTDWSRSIRVLKDSNEIVKAVMDPR